MSKEYTKLDNFIRSYFNQDTVYDLDSDNLGKIIDLYLSEVGQNGVKQLLLDVSEFIDDNENQNIDKYFEDKFSSYLDISPAEEFFSLLNEKYLEKYPAIKSTVASTFENLAASKKIQYKHRILKISRERVLSHGFGLSPVPIAASAGLRSEKGFKRNSDKRGTRKAHYVMITIKPKAVALKRTSLAKKRQLLSNALRYSIEATDIILKDNIVKSQS